MNALRRSFVHPLEGRAQDLVTADDLPHCRREKIGLETPLQAQRTRQVVERPPGLPAVDEPQPLLREGERQRAAPGHRHDRRQGRGSDCRARPEGGGEPRDRRVLEQGAERDFEPQRLAEAGGQLRRQQRVPPEIEEALVDPHRRDPEKLRPDSRQKLLQRAPRQPLEGQDGRFPARGPLGLQPLQSSPVHLPVRGQGERRQPDERRRHHEERQLLLEIRPHLLRASLPPGHQERRQPFAPGGVRQRQHHPLPDLRMTGKQSLDLPQLQPLAPHLDLIVHPAQELQAAVRLRSRQVPGPVQPAAGSAAERVGNETIRRQLRTTEVAPRHARPPGVELAHRPQRHRTGPAVQQVDLYPGDRTTDRRHTHPAALHHPPGDHRRVLRRTVEVDQPETRPRLRPPPQLVPAGEHPAQRKPRRQLRGRGRQHRQQPLQDRRRQEGESDRLFRQPTRQL